MGEKHMFPKKMVGLNENSQRECLALVKKYT